MTTKPIALPLCEIKLAFIRYNLLKSKNLTFSEDFSEDKEIQVNLRVMNFLFLKEFNHWCQKTLSSERPSRSPRSSDSASTGRPKRDSNDPESVNMLDKAAVDFEKNF